MKTDSFKVGLEKLLLDSWRVRCAFALVAMSALAGCAGVKVMNAAGCGTILGPGAPDPNVNISIITPTPKAVQIKVDWTASGTCKLTGGTVKIYLVQPLTPPNVAQYCGQQTLKAQTGTDPNYQTVTVNVPLGTKQPTGTFCVQRLIVGTFNDGSSSTFSNCTYSSTGANCSMP